MINDDDLTNGEILLAALQGIHAELRTSNLIAWHQMLVATTGLTDQGRATVNALRVQITQDLGDPS